MNTYSVSRWHTDEGYRVVLVKRGTKRLQIVIQDFPLHVVSRPIAEERYLATLDYPVSRAVRRMRAFAKCGNATKGALRILKEAK